MGSTTMRKTWENKRDLILGNRLKRIQELRSKGWINPGWGFKPRPENKQLQATLYFIRYLDRDGTHYKIGITRNLGSRFNNKRGGSLISVLATHHSTLGECAELERELLKLATKSGWRYASSTSTELIRAAGYSTLLQWFSSCRMGDHTTYSQS
jgi:hypothetical protein